jgi:hypothetical protein
MTRRLLLVTAAAVFLLVPVCCFSSPVAEPPSSCSSSTTATITWNVAACPSHYIGLQCFAPPQAPTPSDVLLFPTGSVVTFPAMPTMLYLGIVASVIIVDSGAEVTMEGMAMTAINCLIVRGILALKSSAMLSGAGPTNGPFPADSTPPIEQCSDHNGGFTPRLCGPGVVFVSGTLSIENFYASLWAPTSIAPSGTLFVRRGGFLWGTVTNYGLANFSGINYFSGSVINYGSFAMGQTQFVGLFNTSTHPSLLKRNLTIENHASLNFHSATNFNFMVSNVVNYATILVTGSQVMHMFMADSNFFNFGNLTFVGGVSWWGHFGYYLSGSVTNYGVIVSNSAAVEIGSYTDINGTTHTMNGGSLFWGNGAGVDVEDIRPCNEHPDESKFSVLPTKKAQVADKWNGANRSDAIIPCHGNNELCPENFCCGADGFCEPSACNEDYYYCCPNNSPCDSYSTGIYCGGYFFFQEERPCRSELRSDTLPDGVVEELSRRALPLPSAANINGRRRFALMGSRLLSDGTGKFISTESVALGGTVVISGAKWYAMTEFGQSPFTGGGVLEMQQSTLFLGLDSVLSGGGRVWAPRGSSVVVPAQTRLVVKDFTLDMAGGSLHVDGEALLLAQARIDMCLTRIAGEGRLQISNTTHALRAHC